MDSILQLRCAIARLELEEADHEREFESEEIEVLALREAMEEAEEVARVEAEEVARVEAEEVARVEAEEAAAIEAKWQKTQKLKRRAHFMMFSNDVRILRSFDFDSSPMIIRPHEGDRIFVFPLRRGAGGAAHGIEYELIDAGTLYGRGGEILRMRGTRATEPSEYDIQYMIDNYAASRISRFQRRNGSIYPIFKSPGRISGDRVDVNREESEYSCV